MLVLSFKQRESVIIGEDIVVTVLELNGNGVRLGVSAPTAISVWRWKLFEEKFPALAATLKGFYTFLTGDWSRQAA